MTTEAAPKARELYQEFTNKVHEEYPQEHVLPWDRLTEKEKLDWMERAGEKPEE